MQPILKGKDSKCQPGNGPDVGIKVFYHVL